MNFRILHAVGLSAMLFVSACCGQQALTRPVAVAVSADYIDIKSLDLRLLLPDPPANDSDVTRAELAEILRIQAPRTAAQCGSAAVDAVVSPMRFGAALGLPEGFDLQRTPTFKRMSERMLALEGIVISGLKNSYARPRPFKLDPRVQPCIPRPPNDAYPSGHSTWAMMMTLILIDMVPERRSQLLQRETEFANNRVVGGVHYPSDVAAGKTAGTVLAALLLASPNFRADEAPARAELRAVLALH